jgi:hypothetical protein
MDVIKDDKPLPEENKQTAKDLADQRYARSRLG